jgi:hypothetical protein
MHDAYWDSGQQADQEHKVLYYNVQAEFTNQPTFGVNLL